MKYRITLTVKTNVPPDEPMPVITAEEYMNFWNGLQIKMLQDNGVEVVDVGVVQLEDTDG